MRLLPGRTAAFMAAIGAVTMSIGAAQAASDPTAQASPSPGAGVRPTIVLVHGAWADTSSWNGEVEALRKAGYDARAVANPLRNLTSDSATVTAFLKTISGPIVLVGHSYGGSVITNAAAGVPNVKALVFVDAAAPDVGETTAALSGKDSALSADPATLYDKVSYPGAPTGAVDLYLKQNVFVGSFANDLPPETAARLWATQRPASTSAFMTPSGSAAWKTVPSWYFISTGDRIITPASELAMAQRARARITKFAGGSHLTLISHPDAVTAVIRSASDAVSQPGHS
ncbi:alpha/beta hydrolase [Streptosporangiaceae bacterium NEAU-GS5]|nr:alpha/beta hydrolase [Streptosporangiaceae bacterium NEAU-GS5]